jgi:D-alanyl-D-alanine endopeptidase (penicillin-binding protein 7)
MKVTVIALAAMASLALAVGPVAAQAADEQAPAAAKKHVKKHHRTRHVAAHRTSLDDATHLAVRSASALVQDQASGAVLYEKNPTAVVPIASITKLMTAMVVLDAKPPLAEELSVGREDVDTIKGTRSRLTVGVTLTREELLNLALMASENRAAATLSRNYPGGREAFVAAMNHKAQELGLTETHFYDPTGLTAANVSNARDLVKMVAAAREYPLIREFSTSASREVAIRGRSQVFRNTNSLVRSASWDIDLSKTGYISEAGKCLVMEAWVNDKPTIIVLLDSWGRKTRLGDANRIKRMLERGTTVAQQRATAG